MKKRTAAPLMATITALKRALSRTPITSSTIISSTMSTAGRLIIVPGVAPTVRRVIQTGS